MRSRLAFSLLAFAALLITTSSIFGIDADKDSDGDGLTDFHETYKYLTDPTKYDSDGDGKPDGDWLERREYQYTIRSVVQVMRPVTIDYLNDDYQDARILDQTKTYVELEVIHYPFNKVAESISANPNWRKNKQMENWLRPGPTANWTPELRKTMTAELKKDGIDLEKLNDRDAVEKVSAWLCKRAKHTDGFSSFITAFDENGKPYIPDHLKDGLARSEKEKGISVNEQWKREVSAAGMFESKTRGSCTSSAIYLNGCMRAAGIPTRTVLCIPIIDASDENEMAMVERLQQPAVRQTLLSALRPLKNSWGSHTFNEVYVGNHWHRLNYNRLGQNIYDQQYFGLMTHVATFRDWADAKMPETVGRRQKSNNNKNDVFGGANPYSTISLRDEIGPHCTVELPDASKTQLTVERLYWTDDKALPKDILNNCKRRGRFGLIAKVTGFKGKDKFRDFVNNADNRVIMKPQNEDQPKLGVGFDSGCFWSTNKLAYIYVPFGGGDKRDLVSKLKYSFEPRNQKEGYTWKVSENTTVIRD